MGVGRIKSLRLTASPEATTLNLIDTLWRWNQREVKQREAAMGLSWSAQHIFAGGGGFGYVTILLCTVFVVFVFSIVMVGWFCRPTIKLRCTQSNLCPPCHICTKILTPSPPFTTPCQPTVCSLAGRYDNPMPEPTLSLQSRTMNLAFGLSVSLCHSSVASDKIPLLVSKGRHLFSIL
jgi:hypothetical protein